MSLFFVNKNVKKAALKKKKSTKLVWEIDQDTQKQMEEIINSLELSHIKSNRVFCYRTNGSKARAYARIWSFPKIFQQVLQIEPAYVMEIISEKFDKLDENNRKKVIIHELLHIPKNFSGSLLPHKYGYTKIEKEVDVLFEKYKNASKF